MVVQVYRPLSSDTPNRLVVRMPFSQNNRSWLKEVMGVRTRPEWSRQQGAWLVARDHFAELVEALAARFGSVQVTADYSQQEKCTTQCQAANPDTWMECECCCGGRDHGSRRGGGLPVGHEGLIVYGDRTRRTFTYRSDGMLS